MHLRRWRRRLLYMLFLAIWLIVMSFPAVAFLLATRGEIKIGDDQQSQLRLFLLQEPGFQGVSVEWTRPWRQQANCSKSTVNYFLWEGQSDNTTYCQCFDSSGNSLPSLSPQSCLAP